MYLNKTCINCGSSKKVIPFIYKDSEVELKAKHKDKDAIIINSYSKKDSPDYKCKVCGHEWKFYQSGERLIKGKRFLVGRILDLPMASPDSSLYQKGHVIIMRGRNLNEIDRTEEE